MKYQFIAIEGPIGVGKTTLARQLASIFSAEFLSDSDLQNPYLKTFYKDPVVSAFHTQMYFLASRTRMLRNPSIERPLKPIVADFLIAKDKLFAELTLDNTEWWTYSTFYEQHVKPLVKPDLVIYLQAPLERLIERIERRGVTHERKIDTHYLQQLSSLYEHFFHGYNDTPLMIVNTSEIDLANNVENVHHLAERIRSLEGGRHYFNPMTELSVPAF